jgi:hypothetical protein
MRSLECFGFLQKKSPPLLSSFPTVSAEVCPSLPCYGGPLWAHKRHLIWKSECPLSEKLKTWNSGAPPLQHPGFLCPRADPGPIRHPRPPDSQFLEPFRPRHPTPLAGTTGATPGRSRARRRGAESQAFRFSDFRGREGETPVSTQSHIRANPRAEPRENSFRFRPLGIGQFRFGTGSSSDLFRVD